MFLSLLPRLHPQVGQPWAVLCRSCDWCAHKQDREQVCLDENVRWGGEDEWRGGMRREWGGGGMKCWCKLRVDWWPFASGGLPSSASCPGAADTSWRGAISFFIFSLTFPSYLVLYLWKEHCRQQCKDLFSEILTLIAMKQREEDTDHPMAKVWIN